MTDRPRPDPEVRQQIRIRVRIGSHRRCDRFLLLAAKGTSASFHKSRGRHECRPPAWALVSACLPRLVGMSAPNPFTLLDFQRKFPDEEACERHLAKWRWPKG